MKRVLAGWAAVFWGVTGAAADESVFDQIGRSAGLVAPDPDMPDFVKASRPKGTPTPLPAFADPLEPRSKVKSAEELKALDADLTRASTRAGGAGAAPRPKKTPKP